MWAGHDPSQRCRESKTHFFVHALLLHWVADNQGQLNWSDAQRFNLQNGGKSHFTVLVRNKSTDADEAF